MLRLRSTRKPTPHAFHHPHTQAGVLSLAQASLCAESFSLAWPLGRGAAESVRVRAARASFRVSTVYLEGEVLLSTPAMKR